MSRPTSPQVRASVSGPSPPPDSRIVRVSVMLISGLHTYFEPFGPVRQANYVPIGSRIVKTFSYRLFHIAEIVLREPHDRRTATSTPATRGRPRAFSDDVVLDTLIQLFWEQGFEATSMSDIVDATGLSKSSLYNTFGSKDELFEKALNRYVDHRAGMLNEVLQKGEAGLADIETLFDALLAEVLVMDDHRGCLAINTSTELGVATDVVAVSARFRSIMRTGLEATLRGQRNRVRSTRPSRFLRRRVAVLHHRHGRDRPQRSRKRRDRQPDRRSTFGCRGLAPEVVAKTPTSSGANPPPIE